MASAHMQTSSDRSSDSAAHCAALEAKHAGLEARLHEEMTRPAPDENVVRQIKRDKLRIKEELAEI